jgi:hypothetical protein
MIETMVDLTSFYTFWQRQKKWAGHLLLALLIFAAGWQTGRVMSPYYAAHPIVFEERKCPGCSSVGGTVQELESLRQQGIAIRQMEESPALAQASPQPTVAAAKDEASPVASPPQSSQKMFVASSHSDKYHHKDCPAVKQIKEENQVWFATAAEAEAAGYSPSKCTQDKLSPTKANN